MDDTHFDAWTRRRFGLAAGGAAASLLGGVLGSIGLNEDEAEAARNHRNNNKNNKNKKKNKKKNKCRKLGDTCNDTRRNQKCCSAAQLCAQVADLGSGNFCCKQLSQTCSVNTDCCGANRCRSGVCQTP